MPVKNTLTYVSLFLLLGLFCMRAKAAEVFRVDLGCNGYSDTWKEGWTIWEIPGGCDGQMHDGREILNIAGTGINAYIATLDDSGHHNLWSRSAEPIANTAYICTYYQYKGHPDASIELRLSGEGLIAGRYTLLSYHSWSGLSTMPIIRVNGTGVGLVRRDYNVPIQDTTSDSDLVPSEVSFHVAGTGSEVRITYEAAQGSTAALNAFILYYHEPTIRFEEPSSGALETESPVSVDVVLTDRRENATYTVDYTVTGGTATAGLDYQMSGGCG
jgi:hypothetical protein